MIRQVDALGGFQSAMGGAFMLQQQDKLRELERAGDEERAAILINNFRSMLVGEVERLSGEDDEAQRPPDGADDIGARLGVLPATRHNREPGQGLSTY